MSTNHALSRRNVLLGLGGGSLGLTFAAHPAAQPPLANRETGASGGTAELAGHPMNGMWLALVGLTSDPDTIVAVPSFFGADGSAILCYPGSGHAGESVQVKSPAMGVWTAIDARSAHVTAVQVLSDLDGAFAGSVTFDTIAYVSDDYTSFEVDAALDTMTIRDTGNRVIDANIRLPRNHLRGYRMQAGNPGFVNLNDEEDASDLQRGPDPRTP